MGHVVDEVAAIAERIHRRDHGGQRGPFTLEIYPTLLCNLACKFCDTTIRTHRDPDELSAQRQLALIDEAADFGARRVMVLGGGEPLLAPHTPALLRRIKARGMAGMLTTNGTLLTDPVRRLLVEIAWDEVHISVDGATPATHDRLRGRAGAFRKTIAAVCRLRGLRDATLATANSPERREFAPDPRMPRLTLHCVLTRLNVDELPALVSLAAAVGADAVELDALVAYRPEQAEFALTAPERTRLPTQLREGMSAATRVGVRTNFARFLASSAVERGTVAPPAGDGTGYRKAPCLKPWHHLVIAADGHLSPCCVLAGEGESVADVSLSSAWEGSPYLGNLRERMLSGTPGGRCAECSENILVHERNIRAELANVPR